MPRQTGANQPAGHKPSAYLHASLPTQHPLTPLLLSDRLLSLAEQADRAGMRRTAERILRLATVVLNEPPPLPQ